MMTDELKDLPTEISLDRLVPACLDEGVDVHKVIAKALSEEQRINAKESGMNMKAQADLAWKIIDKVEPSKQSVKHSGDVKEPVRLIIEG